MANDEAKDDDGRLGSMWWLSFVDDSGFLGAAIVGPAADLEAAVSLAHVRGCNPGGRCKGAPLPARCPWLPQDCDRLMGIEQAREMDDVWDRRRDSN